MADAKISALTGATTPLAGTEVLPIVQSGATRRVATDNLTVKNIRSNATTGILQIAGPTAAATRTMTVPDSNFTAARTDTAQSFSGLQTFGGGVSVTSGKVTSVYGAGGDFVALFQNTTSATPYGVWIKDAASPAAGYPLLNISDSAGTTIYFRVDSSNGNTTLGTGNLIIGTSGKGIDFSATPGTGTSELFNDYEEGTFTPAFDNLTVGNGTSQGRYTKMGRTVFVEVDFVWGSTTSASGTWYVNNLPFTVAATFTEFGVGNILDSGTENYTCLVSANPSNTLMRPLVNNASATYLANTGVTATVPMTWTTNDSVRMTLVYTT